MVVSTYPMEEGLPQIVSKAPPLKDLIEGRFTEESSYSLHGKKYAISDLPDYVKIFVGVAIENYFKLKEEKW